MGDRQTLIAGATGFIGARLLKSGGRVLVYGKIEMPGAACGDLPVSVRVGGFKVSEVVDDLVKYVQSGRPPQDPGAALFLATGRAR